MAKQKKLKNGKHVEREVPKSTRVENAEVRGAEKRFDSEAPTFTKNERRAKEIVDTVDHMDNDPEWYKKNAGLINSVGNLPYGWRVGQDFDLSVNIPGLTVQFANTVSIPGVLSIGFFPTPGVSLTNTSPINKAALANYRYIRFKKNGNTPYEVADLLMVYLATDSLYCLWANAARAYGYANLFTPMNDYLPRKLVVDSGFDFDDIQASMGDFLYEINMMASMLQKIAVPAALSMYDRHLWMLSNYFADSKSTKAQLYQYKLEGVWQFNNTAETGSQLDFVTLLNSDYTAKQWKHSAYFELFMQLYNALVKDADFGTMIGDIENAYGPSGLRSAPMTEAGSMILPIYSEEVLSQIENCVCWGNPVPATNKITQDPDINNGNILYQPTIQVFDGTPDMRPACVQPIVNYHGEGQPSVDFNMVATRAMPIIDFTTLRTNGQAMLATCGTEYYTKMWQDQKPSEPAYGFSSHMMSGSPGAIDLSCGLTQFDWHPFVYFGVWSAGDDPVASFVGILGDVDNWQIANTGIIAQMHEVAIMSEFLG